MNPRLKAQLQLVRAPAVPTAISNILAAHLIATQGEPIWADLLALMAASALLYMGGMALNDSFDADEDARDRPQRPIPSGRLSLMYSGSLGILMLTGGLAMATLAGTSAALIAGVLALLILLYNSYAKHTVAGPLVMGSCRYGNWLLGLSPFALSTWGYALALPIFLYVVSLTVLSRVETTAIKRGPILVCGGGIVLVAATIIGLWAMGWFVHDWALALVISGAALALWRLRETWNDFTPSKIQKMVGVLVMGVIPLDSAMVFLAGPWWGGFVIMSLWFPGRWLGRFMSVS